MKPSTPGGASWTLSLVCRGRSVLRKMAVNNCVKKTHLIEQRILFND